MANKKDQTLALTMGSVIKALRVKRHQGHGGQLLCAADFGVSQSEWSRWERGIKVPSAGNQKRIAEFFGVAIGDLWGDAAPTTAGESSQSAAYSEAMQAYRVGMRIQKDVASLLLAADANPHEVKRIVRVLQSIADTLESATGKAGNHVPGAETVPVRPVNSEQKATQRHEPRAPTGENADSDANDGQLPFRTE